MNQVPGGGGGGGEWGKEGRVGEGVKEAGMEEKEK